VASKPVWVDNYAFRAQEVIPKLLIRLHDMKKSFYEFLYREINFMVLRKLIFLLNIQSLKSELFLIFYFDVEFL
jgi:hypothetical protein